VPFVRWDSESEVDTIIKWNSSSTDDVCNSNRRPNSSRHTEDCHSQNYNCKFDRSRYGYYALPTTVPAVLADSLLHCFLPRDGRDLVHIQHYVSESVQSCDDAKQLLQGEKQQKFYVRRKFIAFWPLLFSNPYCYYISLESSFNFFFYHHNTLRSAFKWRIIANYFDKSKVCKVCQKLWRQQPDIWQVFELEMLQLLIRDLFMHWLNLIWNCSKWKHKIIRYIYVS